VIPTRVEHGVPGLRAAPPVVLLIGVRGVREPGTAPEVTEPVGVEFLVRVVPVVPAG